MKRKASAVWNGTLQAGHGSLSTTSGVLPKTPYSFNTRFAEEAGTNPEELIAAAHAGCFSMALSGSLAKAGYDAQSIETTATLTFDKVDGNWTIKASHLTVQARVPGVAEDEFQTIAEDAKVNCPVSRVLKAELSMDAKLTESSQPTQSTGNESVSPELQH